MMMYINGSSEMKEIEDNHDLFKTARKPDNGAHLFITLFKEDEGEEQWEDNASDSEAESDDEHFCRFKSKPDATLKRFVKNEGECHHCHRTDGLCYQYSMNSGYFMCAGFHNDLTKKQKKSWKLAGLQWKDEVPSYPLYREEGSPLRDEVCYLLYLLTRIGVMSLSDTDELT